MYFNGVTAFKNGPAALESWADTEVFTPTTFITTGS